MSVRLMNRTERLAAIEQMLFRSNMGLRAVEIAQECHVDRRTIYRDLTLLADVGVPIQQKDGRFYLDRRNYDAPIRLTFDEAVSLFLAARLSIRLTEQDNPQMTAALHKLGLALPTPLTKHIESVAQSGSPQEDQRYRLVLEMITRAWAERRKVKISYVSIDNDKPKLREFSPYFVEPAPSGLLYTVGFDSLTQRVRAFNLQRIRRAQLLPTPYQLPNQFDPRRYVASGWGGDGGELDDRATVVLIFSPDIAPQVQQRVRAIASRVEIMDDQRLKLTVQVADWSDVLPWIRSWGPGVEVVEPEALRIQCAQEAEQLSALYTQRIS